MTTLKLPGFRYSTSALEALCRRWGILKLAVFGPAARNDLNQDDKVDVMVTLDPGSKVSAWDLITLEDELTELFGRMVSLMEDGPIANPPRGGNRARPNRRLPLRLQIADG